MNRCPKCGEEVSCLVVKSTQEVLFYEKNNYSENGDIEICFDECGCPTCGKVICKNKEDAEEFLEGK